MYETNIDFSKPSSGGSVVETTTEAMPVSTIETVAAMGDTGDLRGVSDAAADVAPCTCPDECERDHANE